MQKYKLKPIQEDKRKVDMNDFNLDLRSPLNFPPESTVRDDNLTTLECLCKYWKHIFGKS